MQSQVDVVIVGAGPTGLSMAIELTRYGIPFRIFDKQIKPVSTSNALAAQTRTLEIWQELGLLPNALSRGLPIKGGNIFSKDKKIAEITFDHLHSDYHFLLAISQHQVEDMLLTYLKEKNVNVEMDVTLTDLIPLNDAVDITLTHANGTEEKILSNWIVACDGSHSWVREKMQVPFIGKELTQHFVFADVEIMTDLAKDHINLFMSPKGILAIIPYDKKYSRVIADTTFDTALNKATSLSFEQVRQLIHERCPIALDVKEPIWTSGFWIHERMSKDFQSGPIFFAGDSAHIHSPVGGQGMNTGIQDANNLAWKLASVIQKKATPAILETYSQERQSVAKKVLKVTTLVTQMMTVKNPLLQFARNQIMANMLHSPFVLEKMTNTLTQLNIHYQPNLVVKDCLGKQKGPQAGTRLLDCQIERNKLFKFTHGTKWVMLCFMGIDDGADIAVYNDLKKTLEQHKGLDIQFILLRLTDEFADWNGEKIVDKDKQVHELYGAEQACFYLARPDKYIGFRGGLNNLGEFRTWLKAIDQSS